MIDAFLQLQYLDKFIIIVTLLIVSGIIFGALESIIRELRR